MLCTNSNPTQSNFMNNFGAGAVGVLEWRLSS
jgi:hypothetical protein